jgi:tetratricopeptide (TPR) repeat protein
MRNQIYLLSRYGFKKSSRVMAVTGILLFLIGGFYTHQSVAQTKVLVDDIMFTIDARLAIDSLYNQNAEGAWELLSPWKERHPEHPIWHLWNGMELWWNVLGDLDDTSLDDEFKELMMQADFEAGRLLRNEPDHPDALIIRAVATSYIARLHANREEWVTSLQVGRRGYQAHQRLLEVAPDLPDNAFAEGMKLYYSAYIPEAYPVVRAVSWFLPDGDRAQGIETLKKASERGVFARPEATYFLATILLNYEQNYQEAKTYYKYLVDRYPDNSYYRRLYIRTLDQLNEHHSMKTFYRETKKHWNGNGLPADELMNAELLYWLGRAQYFSGELSASYQSFVQALELGNSLSNSRNREFVTLAAFFAGRTAERLQKKDEARKYYQMATRQNAASNARQEADRRLRAL